MRKCFLLALLAICTSTCFSQSDRDTFYLSKNFFTGLHISKGAQHMGFGDAADAMLPDQQAYKLMKKAQGSHTMSTIMGIAGGFLIGYPIGTELANKQKANWNLAIVGGALVAIAVPFNVMANKKATQAVELYNSKYRSTSKRTKKQLDLVFSNQSIGWVLRW